MTHTDPTFRGLLLALATDLPPSQRVTLPVLADLLEERGDSRAEGVRRILRDSDGRLWIDVAREALALFPEGPRWRVGSVARSAEDGHGLLVTMPFHTHYLAPFDIRQIVPSSLGYALPVTGPHWPI